MDKQIIILAAGKGSRMNSELPKVMHKVGGIPMLERVIHNCKMVTDNLILVYSQHLEPYLASFEKNCKLVNQEEQLGTAHAVAIAKDLFDNQQYMGVIYGDNPLITSSIIEELFKHLQDTNSKAVTLAFEYEKTNQYGRIVVDEQGSFQRIVETKFATDLEKKITLCNSGIMAFAPGILGQYIDKCLVTDPKNPKKEFYLTEIIEICSAHGEKVSYFKSNDHNLVVGVNTQDELASANSIIKKN
ncbi:MAG: NTP transferase domain-containing protein [Rickettsiaceae bacterium]|nr:NTP transferase domain-containing protein [Rickettsiaceae bacterium]MDP4832998.1 NTP transferase domain-containing protein [Rickettsiaceae bacterium]MDP5021277.1 NTP transferase domain-containing protein [Rickettsiaceae bacterium]MDP5082694.1 NTP transferase domain-containing protein [Rickettsiaceae bacterium]